MSYAPVTLRSARIWRREWSKCTCDLSAVCIGSSAEGFIAARTWCELITTRDISVGDDDRPTSSADGRREEESEAERDWICE